MVFGRFPAQMASNAEICPCHDVIMVTYALESISFVCIPQHALITPFSIEHHHTSMLKLCTYSTWNVWLCDQLGYLQIISNGDSIFLHSVIGMLIIVNNVSNSLWPSDINMATWCGSVWVLACHLLSAERLLEPISFVFDPQEDCVKFMYIEIDI